MFVYIFCTYIYVCVYIHTHTHIYSSLHFTKILVKGMNLTIFFSVMVN